MEITVPAALPKLEDLPSRPASQVKNRWADVVRQVRESGSVAVTNHSSIEMVLIDTATYRQMVEDVHALRAKERTVLAALDCAFQARLDALQAPAATARVDKLFAARGRLKQRPKAGSSF
jgi:prevent-host-death family protein